MSERQISQSFSRELEIEWGDCDPAGIVYYPRYFEMFDSATAHLIAAASGMTKFELLRVTGAVGFPMVNTGAEFKRSSKFGDLVRIDSTISEIGRSSFAVVHRLFNADELAIEAFEKRVWVKRTSEGAILSSPLPDIVVSALRTYLQVVAPD
jgi:4-hydroxybenzoyl-CoA thioesterase